MFYIEPLKALKIYFIFYEQDVMIIDIYLRYIFILYY